MSVRHVRGKVVDASLNPVAGALVECYLDVEAAATVDAAVIPKLERTTTDAGGWYAFDLAENADFDVWITGTAYVVRILRGATSSELSFVVTDAAYPFGQVDGNGNPYLDVKDLLVAAEPIPGPVLRGPTGATGPPGTGHYEHQQPSAAAVWHVLHNLGFIPDGVIAFDTSGVEQVGAISLDDPDRSLWIAFGAPVTGYASVG